MSAYLIFENISVSNMEAIMEHRSKVTDLVELYKGRYLAIAGKTNYYEGDWRPKELIIIEFPSFEQGEAFYNSAAYKDLKWLRLNNSTGNSILVEGLQV